MTQASIQTWLYGYFTVLAIWGAYLLAFGVLEWRFPAERGQSLRARGFNLHYLLWSQLLNLLLVPPLTVFVINGLKEYYPQAFGWVRGASLPHLVVYALLYYLAYDLLYYTFHRLQHRSPLLWRQHLLHHSDRVLNATTAARHHWLEEPLRVFTMMLPLAILFDAPPQIVGVAGVIFAAWGFFIHANLRLSLGPLTGWICGPQVHRIHHSLLPQHRDKNFAAFFPFWDRLFGTYWAPQSGEFPPTGVDNAEHKTIRQALLSPFGYPLGIDSKSGRHQKNEREGRE
jgi:sterol desaturase/sphingolipid hydroxylase (fatty acid hydroxylase superfamily)